MGIVSWTTGWEHCRRCGQPGKEREEVCAKCGLRICGVWFECMQEVRRGKGVRRLRVLQIRNATPDIIRSFFVIDRLEDTKLAGFDSVDIVET